MSISTLFGRIINSPYLIMSKSKNKIYQVLASRIKGKGEGENVLADFWDSTCDLTVKTAFWKSKVASDTSEVCNTFHTCVAIYPLSLVCYLNCYFQAEIQQQTISDSEGSWSCRTPVRTPRWRTGYKQVQVVLKQIQVYGY